MHELVKIGVICFGGIAFWRTIVDPVFWDLDHDGSIFSVWMPWATGNLPAKMISDEPRSQSKGMWALVRDLEAE